MIFARSMEEQEYLFETGTAGDTGSDRELKLRGVVTTTTDSHGEAKFGAFFSGRWTFLASASDRSWAKTTIEAISKAVKADTKKS